MYISLKFSTQTEKLIERVHLKFFSEYSFMAKGTIISRAIQLYEERGEEVFSPEMFSARTAEPAVYPARVNLTAHAIDFINSAADRYHTSKAAVIESILTSILNQDVSVSNQAQEEVLRLMSWNVDWFRNGARSGYQWEYLEDDTDKKAFDGIVKIVKEFLDKDRSVCFLQEVPYYVKGENGRWRKAAMWENLTESFPENEYEIIVGDPDACVLRQSIAIARKQVKCERLKLPNPDNRVVGVILDKNLLLGVHMLTLSDEDTAKNPKAKLDLWDNLISFVRSTHEPICIAGDFNSYIGCQVTQIEQKFLELLKYAGEITPHVATFNGNTHIDHILTKNIPIKYYSGRVEAEFEYSDHKHIEVSLKY